MSLPQFWYVAVVSRAEMASHCPSWPYLSLESPCRCAHPAIPGCTHPIVTTTACVSMASTRADEADRPRCWSSPVRYRSLEPLRRVGRQYTVDDHGGAAAHIVD